ncbi:MAG: pantoate--beta-alanine ligase [Candidatus Omnitrophota bacterium]
MKIISSISRLRKELDYERRRGRSIGFVPTMGALHEGHASLIRQCRRENDVVVISIFVNPIQFGPAEDFSAYPRQKQKDVQLAEQNGCDIVFHPDARQLLPSGFNTYVEVPQLSRGLCGASRPGHFRGAATIVAKFFNIINPHRAYFGQKDYQQLAIIKMMVADLNFPITIREVKTYRASDGLAMSSRNVYLSQDQRKEAPAIYHALQKARQKIRNGEVDAAKIKLMVKTHITRNSSGKIDYVECVDAKELSPLKTIKGRCLIAVAVFFGKTRLIDNILLQI